MADLYLAEYLSETRGEPLSPSGGHPVTYIVYQTGDHFNLYCVFDRDGSSASNHRELLFRYVGCTLIIIIIIIQAFVRRTMSASEQSLGGEDG